MASTSNPDTYESCRKASIKIRMMGASVFYWNSKFIQCLANPTYIHSFIEYLKYLQHWQRDKYIKFIMYPHCLFFLEFLQNQIFRNAMVHPTNKNYRNNWLKHIFPLSLPEAATAPPSSAPPASLPSSAVPAAPPPPTPTPVTAVALSPMQYDIPPGSGLAKTDLRNASVDPRKRKKDG
ncbi:hypothetical protein H5410_016262 [Solanum commersonii]|uniref:Mediator of RNA polymerase II transcription subunit 31 n=1 Tax=Solanum commersonii TaxID=4109 RepID=A0A9J5ZVX4_SOLCO|nr:hypothetical protein H5410_016262 [Solanum commersonii]